VPAEVLAQLFRFEWDNLRVSMTYGWSKTSAPYQDWPSKANAC